MTAKTSTERVYAMRARIKEQGLAEVRGVYAPLAQHANIKAYAILLQKEKKDIDNPNK